MPLLSLYAHRMHECKNISSVMWPRLDRGANKKHSHLLSLKDLGFFLLFILFREESSKFRQTVAVSFGRRDNLIKASPFKRGGEGEGRKENPSETETSFQPQIDFTLRLCVLDSCGLQWFLSPVHATGVGIHNTHVKTRRWLTVLTLLIPRSRSSTTVRS